MWLKPREHSPTTLEFVFTALRVLRRRQRISDFQFQVIDQLVLLEHWVQVRLYGSQVLVFGGQYVVILGKDPGRPFHVSECGSHGLELTVYLNRGKRLFRYKRFLRSLGRRYDVRLSDCHLETPVR